MTQEELLARLEPLPGDDAMSKRWTAAATRVQEGERSEALRLEILKCVTWMQESIARVQSLWADLDQRAGSLTIEEQSALHPIAQHLASGRSCELLARNLLRSMGGAS